MTTTEAVELGTVAGALDRVETMLAEAADQIAALAALTEAIRARVDGLGCGAAHDHHPSGGCICPVCGVVLPANLRVEYRLKHLRSPHERCPDCGRWFVTLAAHRTKAHP